MSQVSQELTDAESDNIRPYMTFFGDSLAPLNWEV